MAKQAKSFFFLDYKVPDYIKNNINLKPMVNNNISAFFVNYSDDDIRQMTIAKVWLAWERDGLIVGDTDEEKEASFRALLDSDEYAGFVSTIQKHTFLNELSNFSASDSPEKRLINSERVANRIIGNSLNDEERTVAAKRYASLDQLLMNEEINENLYDDEWENPYLEVENSLCETEQQIAEQLLKELSVNGTKEQAEAIALMREIYDKKRAGISTSTDSIRSRLKRLRKATGWALNPVMLNEN